MSSASCRRSSSASRTSRRALPVSRPRSPALTGRMADMAAQILSTGAVRPSAPRHFLDLSDLDAPTLRAMLTEASRRKAARAGRGGAAPDADAPLSGRVLALIFDRPSTRTRVSFDLAMRQLGGETLTLTGDELQLGRGETIGDTARVLSRYVDAIMIRTLDHDALLELAANADVPVINGLTRRTHPCQLMADVLTFEERLGPIAGRTVAWSGDGNNVAASWIHAAARFGFTLRLACPPEHGPRPELLAWARGEAARVELTHDPRAAVRGADCVVTDTFVSMGDEDRDARLARLAPYQVDEALMALAAPHAIFLHCLPAHRGEEVSPGVMDGARSAVWDEAENRLHAQKAILTWCLR
ncbi:MAG: ornithine carbamoyltransferase [Alphaproteobacteria bacterium]|nr:ornithine carbamoyltransferase [Alphaproteobacteria bacterium]